MPVDEPSLVEPTEGRRAKDILTDNVRFLLPPELITDRSPEAIPISDFHATFVHVDATHEADAPRGVHRRSDLIRSVAHSGVHLIHVTINEERVPSRVKGRSQNGIPPGKKNAVVPTAVTAAAASSKVPGIRPGRNVPQIAVVTGDDRPGTAITITPIDVKMRIPSPDATVEGDMPPLIQVKRPPMRR